MKTYKSIIRCMTAAALVLCCAGCTDLWDEHYIDQPGVNGSPTLTLWEQIQQNSELKNFAEICEITPFRTSETNKPNGYTFAHLLGKPMADGTVSNVTLTVFAPRVTDEQCDSIKKLLEAGQEWQVQTQFLANHIRRNRLDVTGKDTKEMYMLNSKLYTLDAANGTFRGVKITEPNLCATNGVLHVLEHAASFNYNLHEYLRAIAPENDFARLVIRGDSSYFDQYSSIEGEPDEYGRITYIDSVFYTTNEYFSGLMRHEGKEFTDFYFSGFGLVLSQEDSMFAMIIPDNNAFKQAVNKVKNLYRYSDYYENNATRDAIKKKTDTGFDAITRALPNVDDDADVNLFLDSLQNFRANGEIMRSLVFNMNTQYRGPKGNQTAVINAFDLWKDAEMVDTVGYLTSRGDTLRTLPFLPWYYTTQRDEDNNVYGIDWESMLSQADPNHVFNPRDIFDGVTPVRMSNGLVYNVKNYNYDIRTSAHKDLMVEAEHDGQVYQMQIEKSDQSKTVQGTRVNDSIMNERGWVSNGYLSFGATGTSGVEVTFKLPRVLSAKYDIYVVTVPEFYNTGNFHVPTFTATLNYVDENFSKTRKTATKKSAAIEADSSRVHTYLLFEDFEFPCSYADLNYSYPTITFTTQRGESGKKKVKTNNLCIDMIYLKAKE